MTKRVRMSAPEYPARKAKSVPGPIIMLIGACAGWFGFSNQSMDQIQIPEVAQAIVAELQEKISEDIAEIREHMEQQFNN